MASEASPQAALDESLQNEPPATTEAPDTSKNLPISHVRLEEIVTEACDNTLQFSDSYQHPLVGKWNTNIIQSSLALLIKESNAHKFIVTSTIIQHTTPPAPFSPKPAAVQGELAGGLEAMEIADKENRGEEHQIGRRGLHSATGAYWNNERDGTWSWQWNGSEKKGFDVIITIFWVATV